MKNPSGSKPSGSKLVYCLCCRQYITAAAARNHLEGIGRPAAAATRLLARNGPPSPKIAGARRPQRKPPAKKRRGAAGTEGAVGDDGAASAASGACLYSSMSTRMLI
jgi:hypothetical protein